MTLTPGTRLGPYEIVAPLGAGGMGEVYRARDTRLGRDVAVKVLPQHLSANADVRARFEREAKTVSSLNHPNICTLFDVGREGETDYLVMELVEGTTLAERLHKGALPMADVLRFGSQIADALDRAHRAGVVHRDLKPGNVMITKSGAKLMDFGLARASAAAGPVSGSGATMAALTQHPTVASPLTAEGAIVGTFQYMSPEQLEGREADSRSDLWALGCVLYEMATGKRAFEGRSQASLISAIMGSEPAPLAAMAPMSPPALERVVTALLAKDADDRIQTAHDVKLQLGWISEPGSQVMSVSSVTGVPVFRTKPRHTASFAGYVVGALGLIAAAIALWQLYSRTEPTLVTQVPAPRDLRLGGAWGGMALSPTGEKVVACAQHGTERQKLWLWRLDSPDPVAIEGTTGAGFVTWSPDGRSVAYVSMTDKAVSRVSVSGGSPTRLADITDPRGLSWGRKGVIVFAPSPSGPLMKLPAEGGTPEPATELDASRNEAGHRFPAFLPDGEHFLFTAMPAGPNGYTIRVGSLGSKRSQVVMEANSGVTYVEPGYLVFVVNEKVTAQRFDLGKMKCVGERFTLGDAPVRADVDGEPVATSSRDGRLLYPDARAPDQRIEWLDRSGAPRGVIALPAADWNLSALSPDQRTALATSDGDLWQVDLERGVPTKLLQRIDPYQLAHFSPDGSHIVATSHDGGREALRIIRLGGSGPRDSVPSVKTMFVEAQGWASDGRSLLVAGIGAARGPQADDSWDLYVVPLDGGPPTPYLATPAFERRALISPDGRWAAYVTRIEGRADFVIDSYPVPGHRVQIFSGAKDYYMRFMWGRGGRELIYSTDERNLVSLPLEIAGDVIRPGKPTTLFEIPSDIDDIVTRDGERFLATRRDQAAPGPAMRLVQHWTGLLKK
ncbi:MAG: protein kinase [Candidatus Eisenbacteria bacterium]|uniref:Protein kinase n=1 Tax=Eiseniibacteriota bacterium TaxID=2212470 RepID=A0A933SEF3_UNCEI|nr:protein kinase [Candidatus Eisenbacteria bacterium]